MRAWLGGAASALVCEVGLAEFETTDVAACLRNAVAGGASVVTLDFAASLDAAVEHHALFHLVRSLERATEAEEPLPSEGLTLGALWTAAHSLVSMFGFREDEATPPNVLVLRGFGQLADPSSLEWTAFFRVAAAWTHLLFLDCAAPKDPAFVGAPVVRERSVDADGADDAAGAVAPRSVRSAPTPSNGERPSARALRRVLRSPGGRATPWALSEQVRARVEAAATDAATPVGPYVLRAAPTYAQHDDWPVTLARVLATPTWLTRWRGRPDWALGVTVSVRRYRSILERACFASGEFAELLPQIVGAALTEALFLSRLENPEDLAAPAVDELRASALDALEQPGLATPAQRPDPSTPLAELDDFTAIGVRAAMLPFEPAGSALAQEAVALQLRAGDDDTFVELARAAAFLSDAQRGTLILHRLGHEDLRRMLRPHGSLATVAPLLQTLTDPTVRERVRAVVERGLTEGIPLVQSFS